MLETSTSLTRNGRTEFSRGIFGAFTYALIGTATRVVCTRDYRMAPEGRWNRELVMCCNTSFEDYVVPSTVDPEAVVIHGADIPLDPPAPAEVLKARRLRLSRDDFFTHGYTAGCRGFVTLQRGLGIARNHSEVFARLDGVRDRDNTFWV